MDLSIYSSIHPSFISATIQPNKPINFVYQFYKLYQFSKNQLEISALSMNLYENMK